MKTEPYTFNIAGETFTSKKSLQDRIKSIVSRYPNGVSLREFDYKFMMDVLKLHPEVSRKIGVGVVSMCVLQNPKWPTTRTFYITRTDGSTTDFSYIECLSPSSKSKKFANACRTAVENDIIAFKIRHFEKNGQSATCPVTGDPIGLKGSHVDHKSPNTFERLVEDFVKSRNIDVDKVEIAGGEDNSSQDRFADQTLTEEWRNYHNANAKLWVVSAWANLSVLRKRK